MFSTCFYKSAVEGGIAMQTCCVHGCREGLESGTQLPAMIRIWACCPVGLQVVEATFFAGDFHMFVGGCTGHPALSSQTGLPHQALERLLVASAALGLESALQVGFDPGSLTCRAELTLGSKSPCPACPVPAMCMVLRHDTAIYLKDPTV